MRSANWAVSTLAEILSYWLEHTHRLTVNNKAVVKKASKKLVLNLEVANSTSCVSTRKKKKKSEMSKAPQSHSNNEKKFFLGSLLVFIHIFNLAHTH